MTKSMFQPETFPEDFCMYEITVALIGSNILSMSLFLVIVSAFECE